MSGLRKHGRAGMSKTLTEAELQNHCKVSIPDPSAGKVNRLSNDQAGESGSGKLLCHGQIKAKVTDSNG